MASSLKNLSDHDPSSIPNASGKKFGIVVSEYHDDITMALMNGATETLLANGVREEDIFIEYSPGAFEMPLQAMRVMENHNTDAVICIGCVIKGDTDHDKYINHSVAQALQNLSLRTKRPFIFGLLTPNTKQQALDRAGGVHGNKGIECALAALKMVDIPKAGFKVSLGF